MQKYHLNGEIITGAPGTPPLTVMHIPSEIGESNPGSTTSRAYFGILIHTGNPEELSDLSESILSGLGEVFYQLTEKKIRYAEGETIELYSSINPETGENITMIRVPCII